MADDSSSSESKAKVVIPDLPLDIMGNIISRLPLKLMIGCKILSKPFNVSISHPSFNNTHLINNITTYFHFIVHDSHFNPEFFSLDLLEFPRQYVYEDNPKFKINKLTMLNEYHLFFIWGYCNGLFFSFNIEFECGPFNLFIMNPILAEFIKLPKLADPYVTFWAYGLGHCQFTNKYKVLVIVTEYEGGEFSTEASYILTVGVDKEWRRVCDGNLPRNLKMCQFHHNPHAYMVALRSALHWIVEPIPSNFGHICAFDVTEEKATTIPFPSEGAATDCCYGQIVILLDKLCLWQYRRRVGVFHDAIDLWVMDEYGVQGSWTKKFALGLSSLPKGIKHNRLIPLTVSIKGLIVLYDCNKLVIYDLENNKCLKVIPQTGRPCYPIPFVPSLVSIRSLVQG